MQEGEKEEEKEEEYEEVGKEESLTENTPTRCIDIFYTIAIQKGRNTEKNMEEEERRRGKVGVGKLLELLL